MIVVDPGHGGADPGCRAGVLAEKVLTLYVGKVLRDLAQSVDLPLGLTREADVTMPLSARGQLARNLAASQVVSIHFDTNADPRVGRMTCYCDRSDRQSIALGKAVIRAAPAALTEGSRIIYVERDSWTRRAYNVVHAYRVPALLIECAFVSNPRHVDFLHQPFGLPAISAALFCALIGSAERYIDDGSQ